MMVQQYTNVKILKNKKNISLFHICLHHVQMVILKFLIYVIHMNYLHENNILMQLTKIRYQKTKTKKK
jgi:hypothetical protein